MYALVEDGKIVKYPYSIRDLKNENPQTSFPRDMTPALLERYGIYEVTPTARPNYDIFSQKLSEGTPELVDGKWTQVWGVEDETDRQAKDNYLSYAASLRLEAETTGISVGGFGLPTDDRTKMLLSGKVTRALIAQSEGDHGWTCLWKGAFGWVSLTAPQVIGLGKVMDSYVQSCFDHEGALAQQIEAAANLEDLRNIDFKTGWPARIISVDLGVS